jgi:two-component system nitrogen regulation response regulator GlnG
LPSLTLASEALVELQRRPWTGNVRELRNAIEHAVVLARTGAIEPWHLPTSAAAPAIPQDVSKSLIAAVTAWSDQRLAAAIEGDALHAELLKAIEPPLFAAALKKANGQVAAAARLLGLHRTTLKSKLDEYGLTSKAD